MNRHRLTMFFCAAAITAAACNNANTTAPTAPTAPTPAPPVTNPAPTVVPANINAPVPVAPVNGSQVTVARPTIVARNAERTGTTGPLTYTFEFATDDRFDAMVAIITTAEGPIETGFVMGQDVENDRIYFWRVRAFDGSTTGEWSSVQHFLSPATPPPPPPPPPAPVPQPPAADGNACNSGSGLAIVECERNKYGFMNSSQLVQFLRNVATSLNRNGVRGGGFGILHKTGGHNCNGYSCDIMCQGQGGGQRQYDVLSDADGAQIPVFNELGGSIRTDVCEIQ